MISSESFADEDCDDGGGGGGGGGSCGGGDSDVLIALTLQQSLFNAHIWSTKKMISKTTIEEYTADLLLLPENDMVVENPHKVIEQLIPLSKPFSPVMFVFYIRRRLFIYTLIISLTLIYSEWVWVFLSLSLYIDG